MKYKPPLVTIGIPTFNRASMLRRSLDSALRQDYSNIQVIVSDNASVDKTAAICEEYRLEDKRVIYIRQSTNIGAVGNFNEVLKRATGEYFMWLGDDDWIDVSYVDNCMSCLASDQGFSLVSGSPVYYKIGKFYFKGKIFSLLSELWFIRVIGYYARVADNGIFYGLMRTAELRNFDFSNALGGDWHWVARLSILGKTKMLPTTTVHRELGGASVSYSKIVSSAGLPRIQAIFPMLTIGYGAYRDIILHDVNGGKREVLLRYIVAIFVFIVLIIKPLISVPWRIRLRIEKIFG